MKRGYSKKKYHQRSKDETIFSVIKRVMGENVRSVRIKAQNSDLRFRVTASPSRDGTRFPLGGNLMMLMFGTGIKRFLSDTLQLAK